MTRECEGADPRTTAARVLERGRGDRHVYGNTTASTTVSTVIRGPCALHHRRWALSPIIESSVFRDRFIGRATEEPRNHLDLPQYQ